MGEMIWVKVEDQTVNRDIFGITKVSFVSTDVSLNEREVNMLTGTQVTNTTLATAQPTLTATEGPYSFITNNGNIQTYSMITGITRTDFET